MDKEEDCFAGTIKYSPRGDRPHTCHATRIRHLLAGRIPTDQFASLRFGISAGTERIPPHQHWSTFRYGRFSKYCCQYFQQPADFHLPPLCPDRTNLPQSLFGNGICLRALVRSKNRFSYRLTYHDFDLYAGKHKLDGMEFLSHSLAGYYTRDIGNFRLKAGTRLSIMITIQICSDKTEVGYLLRQTIS